MHYILEYYAPVRAYLCILEMAYFIITEIPSGISMQSIYLETLYDLAIALHSNTIIPRIYSEHEGLIADTQFVYSFMICPATFAREAFQINKSHQS